jgi:hypothetical protein
MNLIRLDSNPNPKPDEYPNDHLQNSYTLVKMPDQATPEEAKARFMFPRFGRGEQKRSDFAVDLEWLDVRWLVGAFIEMEHPEALHLERVMRLVRKIEDAGWYNDDLPNEEFWEILP